jgi:hypothetical protein
MYVKRKGVNRLLNTRTHQITKFSTLRCMEQVRVAVRVRPQSSRLSVTSKYDAIETEAEAATVKLASAGGFEAVLGPTASQRGSDDDIQLFIMYIYIEVQAWSYILRYSR